MRIDGKAARRIIKAYSERQDVERPGRDARAANESIKSVINKGAIIMKKEDIFMAMMVKKDFSKKNEE